MTPRQAATDVSDAGTAALAPSGRLRVAINVGNPILARLDPATGLPAGVSVDLARRLATRLGTALELVVYDAAGKSVEGVASGEADCGFFAIDPNRGETIAFTAPYVLIEGCYLVRTDSPIQDNSEVDQAGHTVVVGKGSAYDLFLTRTLGHASILRAPTSPAVVGTFMESDADVAAGVRQQLEMDARRLGGGLRLLDGRFMVIRQAMGTARDRGPKAAAWLAGFVEDAKADGFVAEALARHGIQGASVAPAA
ncbi:transporter substrate-binding domain-containing protein [Castellaniella sp. GW247-6E4]|uniref:transporter substrate-binding domain-containing protein n=1 Tax=Castellaniella sp. GW247-6E4 TaxID=3140380 RepID=UPI003315692D